MSAVANQAWKPVPRDPQVPENLRSRADKEHGMPWHSPCLGFSEDDRHLRLVPERRNARHTGERAPLDNPAETHGICRRHTLDLLDRMPSRSFPGVRLLLVVSAKETAL